MRIIEAFVKANISGQKLQKRSTFLISKHVPFLTQQIFIWYLQTIYASGKLGQGGGDILEN